MKSAAVKKIWKTVCKAEGVRIVYGRRFTAWTTKRVAKKALKKMGVSDIDGFLSRRYISVQVGKSKRILCPVKIGTTDDLVYELEVLAHELEHFEQLNNIGGWTGFYAEYFLRPGARAEYEGSANGGGADVRASFGLKPRSAASIFTARYAKDYKFKDSQLTEAANAYRRRLDQIERGRCSTTGGAKVIAAITEVLE